MTRKDFKKPLQEIQKVIKYRKLHTNTFNPFFKNELKFITIKAR